MIFYAVKKGRKPGIYYTEKDCKKQVENYPNAEFEKFTSKGAAYVYIFNDESQIYNEFLRLKK